MTENETPTDNTQQTEEPEDQGLRMLWTNFNTWDHTAEKKNKVLKRWRKLVLIFIIAGAFTGVLSSNFAAMDGTYFHYISQGLAFISTLFVALAAYAGSEILTDNLQKAQINARAAAETYKSETYLYLFKVPPYDQNPEKKVFERLKQLEEMTSNIAREPLKKKEELRGIPNTNMTIDDYLKERVEDQVYNYFTNKIQQYQKLQKRGKNVTLAFGFAGVIIGALSSTGLGFARHTASWIAFITSASAAITSYMATNRFQYLISSFQSASNRLKTILAWWRQLEHKDENAARQFVQQTENELNRENQSWIQELSQKLDEKYDIGQVAQQQKKE